METARNARVLLKSTNQGTLTLLTKHYNEYFPMSQNLPFVLSTEGEILFYLNNLEIKNRGIKDYNRAGLYVSQGLEAVEIMGRLIPFSPTDLRYNRITSQFFVIHKDMQELEETSNYAFYVLKNDFARYFTNPNEFQSLSFEGMKVNPPVSPIELSLLAQDFAAHHVFSVDSDGFFFKEHEGLSYKPFESTLYSVEEISKELGRMFNV
ncbi:hypothetical protein DOM21_06335 [Bacteriovorax stolpii]|uniref:Uncharacterized protein n=1 Tax=Bacteriovorax stolpii TaxID=960 RepID=A0A2K9NTW1_BACTC|nr:hypothetical protein [Bacteriovorax stolpii]AUN98927.1 hypothetical protein C0V70_12610 [Bacteriovorax stolpii]QDK41077.1 hypothetical protein DOM21_06335 [Bacteriovorax stolpii]TDP55547.1 hypothetical protein C8D79_0602 [Bacteriovorax stolpii]